MSETRIIKILADAASADSPQDVASLKPVSFRRGDDLSIAVVFLQNKKIADLTQAHSATLEILDIGAINTPSPRTVELYMRKTVSVFNVIENSVEYENENAEVGSIHALFDFSNIETQIPSGEKWLSLRVEFTDGRRVSFCAGWIYVLENYLSEPEMLPIENPQYIKRAEAASLYLKQNSNLEDLPSASSARRSLDVYSKAETDEAVLDAAKFAKEYEQGALNYANAAGEALQAAQSAKQLAESASIQSSENLQQTIVNAQNATNSLGQVREIVNEISDTSEAMHEIFSRTSNVGEFYLRDACLHFPNSGAALNVTPPISFAFTYDCAEFPANDFIWFSAFTMFSGFYMSKMTYRNVFFWNQGTVDDVRCQHSTHLPLVPIGKHSLVLCTRPRPDGLKLESEIHLDGVKLKSLSTSISTEFYPFNFTVNPRDLYFNQKTIGPQIKLSRFKIFNFDMSAEDSPYSISDYSAGRDEPLAIRDAKEGNRALLSLSDTLNGTQIRDESSNKLHAILQGDSIARKSNATATMTILYKWASSIKTGAYMFLDGEVLPANCEVEILAKSNRMGNINIGSASASAVAYASAAIVDGNYRSVATFYMGDNASKLFITPSVVGMELNLLIKITKLI